MLRSLIVAALVLAPGCSDTVAQTSTEASASTSTSGGMSATTDVTAASTMTGTTSEPSTTTESTTDAPTSTTDLSTDTTDTADTTQSGTTAEPPANCYGGDLWLDSPEEFAKLAGYNCIEGNLRMLAGSGPDLAGLGELRSIGGWLHIDDGHEITSLHGLEKLQSVGDSIVIVGAPSLVDASALAGLTTIGNEFAVLGAMQLTALDLGALESLGGDLLITAASLTSLNVPKLTIIPGVLELNETHLPSLAGLASLTAVKSLRLRGNITLTDLSALAGLTAPADAGLRFEDNPALVSLTGLENVPSTSQLYVENNAKLTSLAPLAGLKIASLWIRGNPALAELAPLVGPALGQMSITNNPKLTSLAGLESITKASQLSVQNNPALTSLTGLGLTEVNELTLTNNDTLADVKPLAKLAGPIMQMEIRNNPALTSLDGPGALTGAPSVTIVDNPKLASVTLLTGLTTMSNLHLGDTKLQSLSALAALTSVTDTLVVSGNSSLTSLTGLELLKSADALVINGNVKLASVAALEQGVLTSVPYYLDIAANPALPTCAAKAVLAGLAEPPEYYCDAGDKADACSPAATCNTPPIP